MRKAAYHQTGHFTMLEILVATVVLVIMMGFLFQFITSAQKIWSASESTAGIFDQAQLVFNMLEKDLQGLHFVNGQDYPGHAIPMGGNNENDSNGNFFLVTQESGGNEQIGTYLVMYAWSKADAELARYVLNAPLYGVPDPHFFYGYDPADPEQDDVYVSDVIEKLKADEKSRDVLVSGLQNLTIETILGGELVNLTDPEVGPSYFFNEIPRFLRITLTIHDAKAVEEKKSETARRFSKIIFLR